MKLTALGLWAFVGLLSAVLSNAQNTPSYLSGKRNSFLFISSPTAGSVYFSRLLDAVEQSRNDKMLSRRITGLEYIKEPRGLAVDSLRKILYVVDGGFGNPTLYGARMYYTNDGNVACEKPGVISTGLSSNWVAVDFRGKLFFIADNQLLSMNVTTVNTKLDTPAVFPAATDTELALTGQTAVTGTTADATQATADAAVAVDTAAVMAPITPAPLVDRSDSKVLYDGGTVTSVSMPRGIAVDGYKLFWTNGENGKQDGTLVQGFEDPAPVAAPPVVDGAVAMATGQAVAGGVGAPVDTDGPPPAPVGQPVALDKTLAMAHGVCLTANRVFFTDEEANVYSTKVNGGEVLKVTDKLSRPRGCVFDGDGTVFIADEGTGEIVSFAGAGAELGPRRTSVALQHIKSPYGLAVFHGDRTDLYYGGSNSGASRCAALLAVVTAILISLLS